MHQQPSSSSTCISTRGVWVVCVVALAAILQLAHCTPALKSKPILPHHMSKRDFADQQCRGVYDKGIYARLDRICEDCYNLFREPELHTFCRINCFKSEYFVSCVDSLNLVEERKNITQWIRQLNRRRI